MIVLIVNNFHISTIDKLTIMLQCYVCKREREREREKERERLTGSELILLLTLDLSLRLSALE